MKNIIILIFICSAIQLQAQPDLSELEDFQTGKCYFSYPLDSNALDSNALDTLYIEVLPTIFESYKERLDNIDIPEVSVDEGKLRVEVQPKTIKFIRRKSLKRCLPSRFPLDKLISFCPVEVPARYKTIESVCIVKDGKKLLVPSRQDIFIERKLVIQESTLKVISKEEALNSKNDVYPVVKGEWSQWADVICGCSSVSFSMAAVQRALVNKGYKIEVDGVLGKTTRDALLDFQKKNNLPQGRLDLETRKKLGLKF